MNNKPFLKWAGNKYRLRSHLMPLVGSPKRYCEPFAGSLATALNIDAEEYFLNDLNKDIINLYNHLIESDTFILECEKYFSLTDTPTPLPPHTRWHGGGRD